MDGSISSQPLVNDEGVCAESGEYNSSLANLPLKRYVNSRKNKEARLKATSRTCICLKKCCKMPRSKKTKSSFNRDDHGRTILTTAKEIAV